MYTWAYTYTWMFVAQSGCQARRHYRCRISEPQKKYQPPTGVNQQNWNASLSKVVQVVYVPRNTQLTHLLQPMTRPLARLGFHTSTASRRVWRTSATLAPPTSTAPPSFLSFYSPISRAAQ